MKILAIDTSAVAASAAVEEDDKILCESFTNVGLQHSRTLMPMIDSMLEYTGIKLTDISFFAVSKGPGSFTGIRIGLSAVKGMAAALDIPCVGVSTLEALAYNFGEICQGILCPVMDARCSQVYNALFESDGNSFSRLCEDRAVSVEKLREEIKKLKKSIYLVGDGAELCYNAWKGQIERLFIAPPNLRFQRASSVAQAAKEAFQKGKATDAGALMPSYLRPPQAVRNLKNQ